MEEINPSIRIVYAILAGALAVPTFHEPVVAFGHLIHLTSEYAYSTVPTIPMWVPTIASLMFWGGVLGIFWAFATAKQQSGKAFWRRAFLFGAIIVSIVGWTAVSAAKFQPLFDGGHIGSLITDFFANGMWGIGTAVFVRIFTFGTVHWSSVSLT